MDLQMKPQQFRLSIVAENRVPIECTPFLAFQDGKVFVSFIISKKLISILLTCE
jgi:hypothetical protein